MSVRSKFVLVILLAAVLPVSVSAWTTLGVHQTAFDAKLTELNLSSARNASAVVHARFEASVRALSGVVEKAVQWPALSKDELEGALWLTFSQLDMVAAIAIRDEAGTVLEPVVFIDAKGDRTSPQMDQWKRHPVLDTEVVSRFLKVGKSDYRRTPTQTFGAIFSADPVMVPIALWVDGSAPDAPWTVEVALALDEICAEMIAQRPVGTEASLFDASGRTLCTSGGRPVLEVDAVVLRQIGDIDLAPGQSVELRFSREGQEKIAAVSRAEGWFVVMERSLDEALAPSRDMLNQSLLWIALGLLLAVVGGAILSGAVTKPVKLLEEGANQVAAGNLQHRISLDSNDEFGHLATAFNAMGDEIASWNRELNERVQNQTAELQAAQEQLLEARKLGAMASLSAGIAHELNNPLAGLIGLTQVLVATTEYKPDAPADVSTLKAVEAEAQRMADIVAKLGNLETAASQGLVEGDLAAAITDLSERQRARCDAAGITLVITAAEKLPKVAFDAKRLAAAFDAVTDNAIKAMASGGRLGVAIRSVAGELVVVEVSDTGPGIRATDIGRVFEPFFATKEHWEGTGLGLSLAYQAVAEHHGRISVKSEQKVGTTVTISLPASRGAAHLV